MSADLRPECAAFREVAPELALGIAVGDERAAALDHLAGCPACREELDRLTGTVDALVQVAPAAEPPAGFEVRALDPFEPAAPAPTPAPSSRRWLPVAAAILVVAALVGGAVAWANRDGSTGQDQAAVVEQGDGATLTAPDGADVGQVRVDRRTIDGATRSELVVAVDPGAPQGTYRVQCDYQAGRPYDAGTLEVGADGVSRWSATVTVPTYDLRRVRLTSTDGNENLEAEFPT